MSFDSTDDTTVKTIKGAWFLLQLGYAEAAYMVVDYVILQSLLSVAQSHTGQGSYAIMTCDKIVDMAKGIFQYHNFAARLQDAKGTLLSRREDDHYVEFESKRQDDGDCELKSDYNGKLVFVNNYNNANGYCPINYLDTARQLFVTEVAFDMDYISYGITDFEASMSNFDAELLSVCSLVKSNPNDYLGFNITDHVNWFNTIQL